MTRNNHFLFQIFVSFVIFDCFDDDIVNKNTSVDFLKFLILVDVKYKSLSALMFTFCFVFVIFLFQFLFVFFYLIFDFEQYSHMC